MLIKLVVLVIRVLLEREILKYINVVIMQEKQLFINVLTLIAKAYLNYDDKVKHEKTHVNPNQYGCPVFECPKQEYSDPTSLSKHVRKKHGQNVWDFIKANKKAKKANGYGLIGIKKDGTLYEFVLILCT
uniref:Uncharacterized protein n=1 Tax=Meloidogyne enterolobii TaxID=390850 RepID=A0A6V7XDC5_MELEN|nr:unnamed protein product [Meloidogyne enterolobii]